MKTIFLSLLFSPLFLSVNAFAEVRGFHCVNQSNGEIIITRIENKSVTYTSDRSGQVEFSSLDTHSNSGSLTLIEGETSNDGQALIIGYCPTRSGNAQMFLVVDSNLRKRSCLACVKTYFSNAFY